MKSKERPYVLLVAEIIYNEIYQIRKKNPDFSNIDAIENFIGSKIYNKISSGEFHKELFIKLKNDRYLDPVTKKVQYK